MATVNVHKNGYHTSRFSKSTSYFKYKGDFLKLNQSSNQRILPLSMLSLSLLSILVMFVFVANAIPNIPKSIPLNYDNEGIVIRIGPSDSLFYLPMIGSILWLLNSIGGLYLILKQQEKMLGMIVLTTMLLIQIILWINTLKLTNYI